MKQFQINSLYIKNFKGTEEAEYDFAEIIKILGDNYQGKTTISEAIVFGLFGTTMTGSTRVDGLINKESNKTLVRIKVETSNGEHTIERSATKSKKVIKIGRKEVAQKDVVEIIGDSDLFLASFNPTGILAYKDTAAREFFMRFVSELDPETILENMDDIMAEAIRPLDLENPQETKKSLNAEIKEFENDIYYAEGQLDEVKETLKQVVPDPVEVKAIKEDIEKLEGSLFTGEAPQLLPVDESKLEAIQNEIVNLEQPKRPELMDVQSLERATNHLRDDYKSTKDKIDNLSASFNQGDTCPTCSQEISTKAFEGFQSQVDSERKELEQKLSQYAEQGKAAKAKCEEAKDHNEKLEVEYQKENVAYAKRKDELSDQFYQVKKEITDVKEQNQRIEEEHTANVNARNAEVKDQLVVLRNQLAEAEEVNNSRKHILESLEKAEEKRHALNKTISNNEFTIDRNKEQINYLNEYIAKYAELQEQQISKHFDKVSIQLSDVVKSTGEIKPKFKLLYDGKPIEVLSLSERIRLGLEVSSFVKTVTDTAYPTFIDNAESITHFNELPGQLFTATVVKGQELTVNAS